MREFMTRSSSNAYHPSLPERCAEDPAPPKDPTPVEAMRYRLQTKEGKKR